MVCFYSDQKESFCSDCFSLMRRARWVIPIGRWSKPLHIKRLLLNRIITLGHVNFHIFQFQYTIHGNKRQEIKDTHTHTHTHNETWITVLWATCIPTLNILYLDWEMWQYRKMYIHLDISVPPLILVVWHWQVTVKLTSFTCKMGIIRSLSLFSIEKFGIGAKQKVGHSRATESTQHRSR